MFTKALSKLLPINFIEILTPQYIHWNSFMKINWLIITVQEINLYLL
jgi:hypothetical protein